MWVCSCLAVTDHEIRAEIEAGARDEHDIAERCGAGTDCGTCVDEIRRLCEDLHDGALIRS
jgi:bacterioferritin-associated ferredoxin